MLPQLRTCLYECVVTHARLSPRRHSFAYRIFLFAVDLDELDAVGRSSRLFSVNSPNLYSFRESDFLPIAPAGGGLKERVTAFAREHGVEIDGGRIVLVTLPRIAGYLFNPVSFYFCYDRYGVPAAAVAEVTNTFREVKPYFVPLARPSRRAAVDADAARPAATFHVRVPKHFYVSPYSDVDVAFDFRLQLPDGRLTVHIDDYTGQERTLVSSLAGVRREFSTSRLAWYTLKYPLLTLRVIGLIHWHAFLLWCKRVPWYAKNARASDQRGVYRPHHSLTDAA